MISRNRIGALLLVLVALALLPASASAAPFLNGEFKVSSLVTENRLVEGPDHAMWVTVHDGTHDVARIDPKTGEVKEFDLGPINEVSGIAVGPEGKLWVSEAQGVTSFDPADPEGTKKTTLIEALLASYPIVAGPDGNLWVATSEALVRIPPAKPEDFKVIEGIAGLGPRDIDVAGSTLAIADFSTARILTATPAKAANKEFSEITLKGGSQGLAGTPSSQIGFSATGANPEAFGVVTPPNPPQYTDAPQTDPFGVALGPDGAFWIAQAFGPGASTPGTVTRLGADGKTLTLSGFNKEANPRQIASGPDHSVWVTLPSNEGEDKVARISGVEAPTGPPPPPKGAVPETKLGKGPKGVVRTKGARAKVSFAFTSPDAGASFECRLAPLAARKGKTMRAPSFAACTSPRSYRLKPGRYRFEVRAVLAGVADKSPATSSFKVVNVGRHRRR